MVSGLEAFESIAENCIGLHMMILMFRCLATLTPLGSMMIAGGFPEHPKTSSWTPSKLLVPCVLVDCRLKIHRDWWDSRAFHMLAGEMVRHIFQDPSGASEIRRNDSSFIMS